MPVRNIALRLLRSKFNKQWKGYAWLEAMKVHITCTRAAARAKKARS